MMNEEPKVAESTSVQDWLNAQMSEPSRESPRGYHFIQLYNQNKWNWYLKYVRGLRPISTKPALIEGGIIHSAIEAFLLFDRDIEVAVSVARALLENRRIEYKNDEAYEEATKILPKMLIAWANKWATHDAQFYETLAIEKTFEVELIEGTGITMTMRPDWIALDKRDNRIYIFDRKTTHFSAMKAHESVEGQDQVTAYLWGMKKAWHDCADKIEGLIPDVLYQRNSVFECQRYGKVTRSEVELLEFEQETLGLFVELADKLVRLENGEPPHFLFPRNGKDETFFGEGDYPGLYRAALPENVNECPFGYTVDTEAINGGTLNYLKGIARKLT